MPLDECLLFPNPERHPLPLVRSPVVTAKSYPLAAVGHVRSSTRRYCKLHRQSPARQAQVWRPPKVLRSMFAV